MGCTYYSNKLAAGNADGPFSGQIACDAFCLKKWYCQSGTCNEILILNAPDGITGYDLEGDCITNCGAWYVLKQSQYYPFYDVGYSGTPASSCCCTDYSYSYEYEGTTYYENWTDKMPLYTFLGWSPLGNYARTIYLYKINGNLYAAPNTNGGAYTLGYSYYINNSGDIYGGAHVSDLSGPYTDRDAARAVIASLPTYTGQDISLSVNADEMSNSVGCGYQGGGVSTPCDCVLLSQTFPDVYNDPNGIGCCTYYPASNTFSCIVAAPAAPEPYCPSPSYISGC